MFSADTLARGLQDPALSRQAERIINGSMRMNKLLDDLLAYSRSKLGDGMAIHPVDCDLAQSLGEEVELLRAALPNVPSRMRLKAMPAVASMPLRCARRFTTSRPTLQSTGNTAPMCGSALRASSTRS
ncbi:hypothetical protein [Stenotrophomonas maltophilia]|uniref:hypothetical protein n=1 Tax=Stenotrophomonas maltophilia TaxID=40324 RepID=UPI002B1DAFC9|nr:hypothetical protein [Stenotrophomonas maltophilia]